MTEHITANTPLVCSDERHAAKATDLEQQLAALRKRFLTQLGELGIAYNRLDQIRDAARLHRQQLIRTSELYAVIEALDATPTAAQEEQAAPVDWQDITRERERELKQIGEARHRAEAAIAKVRHLHRPVGVVAAAESGEAPDCAACRRAWPCQTYTAITTKEN